MPRLLWSVVLIAVCVTPSTIAQKVRGWRLASADVAAITLPTSIDLDALDLDYDDRESVLGRTVVLNDDAIADFFVRAAPALCGATGNCPFVIIDGRSGRLLGRIGGNSIVVSERRVNAYPVLETWWSISGETGEHSTYEFDGRAYELTARETLSSARRQRLIEEWRELPRLPNP
ncbi:MAG TPA: hypothetical protein VL263_08795 [Vicinamibacterales bacterium]|nr:hypothetical protein [Vicinamibacterales bacterium]